jgi:hypothetical protein
MARAIAYLAGHEPASAIDVLPAFTSPGANLARQTTPKESE